ncbi:hypothetical protein SASPL_156013 [Salvia splendens]|uniref:Uncharacterized protein n=1 Tax=Salvia splendens TaxID=180675 RepID=A0A8X8VXH8_SALSN|nr:hypothetical protein SASPL_156013 [Salvia splendens]
MGLFQIETLPSRCHPRLPQNRFRGTLISPRTCRLPTPGVLPLLLTVKSSSRLLFLSLDPSIDHLPLALAVVQAPSATAASPRRSSTSPSQIMAVATPEGIVVANFARDEIDQIHPRLRHLQLSISDSFENRYGGLIAELSEARKVDVVAEVVREMMKGGGEAEG